MNESYEFAFHELSHEMALFKERVPTIRWFLFGSLIKGKRDVADIDVLVVCETAADCEAVKNDLSAVCGRFPIHLLIMTHSEEAEVKFIEGERAVEMTMNDCSLGQERLLIDEEL